MFQLLLEKGDEHLLNCLIFVYFEDEHYLGSSCDNLKGNNLL